MRILDLVGLEGGGLLSRPYFRRREKALPSEGRFPEKETVEGRGQERGSPPSKESLSKRGYKGVVF